MYSAIVQRVQRLEISFTEEDFSQWKKDNPHSIHTHENFTKDLAEVSADIPEVWSTYEQDIICIIYNSGRE